MNAYLLSIVRSPKDENPQPFDVFSTDEGKCDLWFCYVLCLIAIRVFLGRTHCQFERIPLISNLHTKDTLMVCQWTSWSLHTSEAFSPGSTLWGLKHVPIHPPGLQLRFQWHLPAQIAGPHTPGTAFYANLPSSLTFPCGCGHSNTPTLVGGARPRALSLPVSSPPRQPSAPCLATPGKWQAWGKHWHIQSPHCASAQATEEFTHPQACRGCHFSSWTLPAPKGWYLIHDAGASSIARYFPDD